MQAWLGGKSCFYHTNAFNFRRPLNRYFWDTRMKILTLLKFNMPDFQLVLTKFVKSELFACLPEVNHVIKHAKSLFRMQTTFSSYLVHRSFRREVVCFLSKISKNSFGYFVDQMLFDLTIAFLRTKNCEYLSGVRQKHTVDWQVNEVNLVVKCSNRFPIPKLWVNQKSL